MTRVKICGIQQPEHAIVAAEAGADFIGLVFVPQRRRRLELGAARAIVSDLKTHGNNPPKVVGLFADQPLEEVNQVIRTCQLDLVQLCGQESLDYCGRVEAGVIKVFHVHSTGPGNVTRLAENIQPFREAGHLVTLDRLVDGLPGGTGQKFDWEIAAQLSQQGHSFLLAGGLTPDNVAHGVATVKPWGVDVSSGVETDGVKDSKKIRAFVRSAKQSIP
jgi:phosphoribosylanthranilate isomerase